MPVDRAGPDRRRAREAPARRARRRHRQPAVADRSAARRYVPGGAERTDVAGGRGLYARQRAGGRVPRPADRLVVHRSRAQRGEAVRLRVRVRASDEASQAAALPRDRRALDPEAEIEQRQPHLPVQAVAAGRLEVAEYEARDRKRDREHENNTPPNKPKKAAERGREHETEHAEREPEHHALEQDRMPERSQRAERAPADRLRA